MTDSKKRSEFNGGRPSKELDAPDWRMQYCERLAETKNRSTASDATPYSYDEIYKKLNPKYSEYDKDFAEMVHAVEMRFLANAEEIMYTAMDHEPSWRNKAWIAKEILKVRDRDRWSDKLDISVEHKGVVRFEANRQKMLAELAEEQFSTLPPARKALGSGEADYIEAEVVREKVSE